MASSRVLAATISPYSRISPGIIAAASLSISIHKIPKRAEILFWAYQTFAKAGLILTLTNDRNDLQLTLAAQNPQILYAAGRTAIDVVFQLPSGTSFLAIQRQDLYLCASRPERSTGPSGTRSDTITLWSRANDSPFVRLVTEVREEELVAMRELCRFRRVPIDRIQSLETITHDVARGYSGYGIRSTREGEAYVADGPEVCA